MRDKKMTVNEMIARVDHVKPNGFNHEVKVSWMSELFAKIKEEVFDRHVSVPNDKSPELYHKYDLNDGKIMISGNSTIDLPESHIDLAEYWLYAKIDLSNADYDRYTNSLILFNNAYLEYRQWYNRNYMPLGVR